jgi:hypothetical protein
MSYDIGGRGKTVLSGGFNVYHTQGVDVATSYVPAERATGNWTDSNGDHLVQASELTRVFVDSIVCLASVEPCGAAAPVTTSPPTDPALSNSRTREWLVRVDHELSPSLTVAATYIGRVYDRFRWADPRKSVYSPFPWKDPVSGASGTSYVFVRELEPGTGLLTNQPGRTTDYRGLELMVRKRLAHRWMLDASYTQQTTIGHYPTGSYDNPTNIDKLNGHAADVNTPRYIVRSQATVDLPWRIRASGVLNVQDGFIRELVFGDSFDQLFIYPLGAKRYPTLSLVDLQVDKALTFGPGHTRFVASVAVLNLLNSNTVTSQVNNESLTTFNNVLSYLSPRVVCLGMSVRF